MSHFRVDDRLSDDEWFSLLSYAIEHADANNGSGDDEAVTCRLHPKNQRTNVDALTMQQLSTDYTSARPSSGDGSMEDRTSLNYIAEPCNDTKMKGLHHKCQDLMLSCFGTERSKQGASSHSKT